MINYFVSRTSRLWNGSVLEDPVARPPQRSRGIWTTPVNLRVLCFCNPAGWEAPEAGKMGRELHSLGVVGHEGRMVLPALNMQEITHSKIWCLAGLEQPSSCPSGSEMNRVSIVSRAPWRFCFERLSLSEAWVVWDEHLGTWVPPGPEICWQRTIPGGNM